MVRSIHRYLVEFKPDEPIETLREPANEHLNEQPSPFMQPEAPDIDSLVEDAYRRGSADAAAAAASRLETEIAAMRAQADDALAIARGQWSSEESKAIAALLDQGLADIEVRIAEKTARALRPFLRDRVREQAIAALCETLARMLHGRKTVTLEMSGPQDLVDAVMRRLNAEGGQRAISINVTDGTDIRVVCDETTIETQISLWAESLGLDDA